MTKRGETRQALIGLCSSLLLGPVEPEEELFSGPADTYLTGILWPRGMELPAAEDDESEPAAGGGESSEMEAGVPGYRAVRPCSLGITFAVDLDCALSVDLGSTARYIPVEEEGEGGRARRRWKRRPLGYRLEVPPGDDITLSCNEFIDASGAVVTDPDVTVHVKRRLRGGQQAVTLTLINATNESDDGYPRDGRNLYQTELRVAVRHPDGRGAIRPRRSASISDEMADDDARSAALLYRQYQTFAIGHGVAARWSGEVAGRVAEVATTWLPTAVVKNMDARGHGLLAGFRTAHPDALAAAWLAREDGRKEVVAALRDFAARYGQWIEDLPLGALEGDFLKTGERHRDTCLIAQKRIEEGISKLETIDDAWKAFCLANLVMDRQSRYPVKKDRAGPLIWRPFQLAYFLMVLPGLVDPAENAYRDCMDLLWFPTGGGKTEAYLGLTAFQILLRRLQDTQRRSDGGVDVMMRYTLRLLTVQQFQRAASLICACEALRQEMPSLGKARITIGLYVGSEATPNRMDDAERALDDEHEGRSPKSTPRQLLECPVCGSGLAASAYAVAHDGKSINITCSATGCATGGKPLPVMTVDDPIYDTPPSLLIGTIDKFAQLPRSERIRRLFGLDGGLGPGLIIQDELHLISGPLGSMAGLYETVVDMLCARDGVRAKVIGSTATIGQAERQVRALFDRPVLQFPPPGLDASDSFFAVRDTGEIDRIYMGVASVGRSPKFALQATAAALLQAAYALERRGDAYAADLDAFWTCVLYFNSLRELGGAHVLMQDDVPRQMAFLATRLGLAGPRPLGQELVELSSRVSSRDLPRRLNELGDDLASSLADPFAPTPKDVVLASNMISVGVDVSRLGLMLVNGQPKSTAEYIQATSRVGRGLEGLVVTLYNFGRPRDVSHFEHFADYHDALYRSVEATSVTPWAPRARDKALHAVVAAAVRHLVEDMEDDAAAADFVRDDAHVRDILKAISARASSSSHGIEGEEAREDVLEISRDWARRQRETAAAGKPLLYWERKVQFGAPKPHLMRSAEEGGNRGSRAWPTPNSMREVEPSTAFILKDFKARTPDETETETD